MHAMWMSVTENIKCGKLTDVCLQQQKLVKCKCRSCEKRTDNLVSPIGNPAFNPAFQPKTNLRRWFSELEIGDPSWNVIEKIYRTASTDPPKQHRTIKKVLRVNNTVDNLEKFEEYRDTVKKRSFEQHKRNPRSIVDGNELLQFHVTTMNCCNKNKKHISQLCKDPTCNVCRLLQSGFRNFCDSRYGTTIQLSTSSDGDAPCEDTSWGCALKRKNVKRAVIVCRTIAGRVINKDDDIKLDEEYDSVATGLHSRSQYLMVKDSSAILPCFIIILN